MRMRAGVWWSAAAITLLAVTSALRTPQVEGVSRTSRRLPAPSAPDGYSVAGSEQEIVQPTFRPRSSRRREETTQRDVSRGRTRSRPEVVPSPEQPQATSANNERFDSRKTRTRNQPTINNEANKDAALTRESAVRTRSRSSRRPTSTSTTQTPDLTSPTIDESRIEVINSNLDDITKIPKGDTATTQFKRRSSVTPTTESVAPRKSRGRVNNRANARSLDLAVSGTTNTLTAAEKAPTTARTAADLRNPRKLRYKTRPSETDTNLTGEGLVTANEVIKSSQIKESVTSQAEIQTAAPTVVETIVRQSTEPSKQKTTTLKVTKVVRRPLGRGKMNFRPTVTLPKMQVSDEISEDDNYPASFKALIQAKNASTQASSPTSESLSLKASQKVYKTASSQSTQTGPGTNKYSRLRNRLVEEETKNGNTDENKPSETTVDPEVSKPRSSEYKPRGTYSARNRKATITPSSTTPSISSSSSSEKPIFKYNRKFKPPTTESPKIDVVKSKTVESSVAPKKTFVRPPVYSRKFKGKATGNIEPSSTESVKNEVSENIPQKTVLPRTSYYSRLRNNIKNEASSTTESLKETSPEPVTKQPEETVDTPLIFALLNNSEDGEAVRIDTQPENKDNHMFLISVTSKESLETNMNNEVTDMADESENMPVVTMSPSILSRSDSERYKFHANYKDQNTSHDVEKDKGSSTAFPPVRNLQTRKYGRNRGKSKEDKENVPVTTPKPKDRSLRKFSESFSKTTEASNNGITPEPDKSKSRFSSKYRASYLDKPFYKPTVPTITSSTAWLKFYVTDHLLTKSVEEPNWFEGDLYTTESMSRANNTTPYFHESSIELVEGEELQLGPGLNAISFTQTRRTLSSEDLRLSESLVKPSHVMNVEASHHSPSVTVSIFDALAEILTSTPKPRISSTTEVTKIQNPNTDVKLDGVSSNINVNSVKGLASQDTVMSTNADVSTTTKSVQPTVQATPNVINSILVGGTVTQSLNIEDGNKLPVNTPTPPTPTSTTPISARRPFAIRVLYSDTESPTDKPTTASTPTQESTDSPKMVYNTVSDLLLSNNNLVSSELTSMLSNNIINIIENMDENSRLKLKNLDMAKVLRNLIPRALDGLATVLDNADSIPNTTPYSLEDIRDTENIDINTIESSNALQSVNGGNVNITVDNRNIPTSVTQNPAIVNSPITPGTIVSTLSVSNSQATPPTTTLTTGASSEQPNSAATPNTTPTTIEATLPVSLETDSVNVDSINDNSSDSTNKIVPLPFLTNFQTADFTASDSDNLASSSAVPMIKSLSLVSSSVSPLRDIDDIQDPSQISRLQLWVLSKKAKVLKMIEDLIRQHNDELATVPPLDDFVSPSGSINLSERLTNIMNTMIASTEAVTTRDVEPTTPMTTPSFVINPLSTNTFESTSENPRIGLTTTTTLDTVTTDGVPSTTETISISARMGSTEASSGTTGSSSSSTTLSTEASGNTDGITSTTPTPTTGIPPTDIFSRLLDGLTTTITNEETMETTTAAPNTETTTQLNVDTTTDDTDTITTTDASSDNNTTQTIVSTLNVGTPSVPKKDFVIFGILPNNTVVRKNPNEDILEQLTEASPYIVYGVLPNNTVIRKFPNGTRVPRVMQKIDILPISPWSLRNPYSPIHNNPAIVRPQPNPIRDSTNTVTSTDTSNNGTERLTNDTVNNQQPMITPSALNIKSSNGITTTNMPEKSTASHVLSLRTTTMLPSIDEILLNSISSAAIQEMVISEMTSSTREPRILTLDIDPETKQIRTEKPGNGESGAVFKFIPIDEVTVQPQNSNVLKLASTKSPTTNAQLSEIQTMSTSTVTEMSTQAPQIQTQETTTNDAITTQGTTSVGPEITVVSSVFTNAPITMPPTTTEATTLPTTTTTVATTTTTTAPTTTTTTTPASTTTTTTTPAPTTTTTPAPTTTTTTTPAPSTTTVMTTTTTPAPTTTQTPTTTLATTTMQSTTLSIEEELRRYQEDVQLLQTLLQATGRNPKNLNLNPLLLGDLTTTLRPTTTTTVLTTTRATTTTRTPTTTQINDPAKLLQALFSNQINPSTLSIPNIGGNLRITTGQQATTTSRSIEDDIKQFEEDTKLLQALLKATGQNPATLNLPSLDSLTTIRVPTTTQTTTVPTTTTRPTTTTPTTTTTRPTTTTPRPTTTIRPTTTQSIEDDLKKIQEDTKLLQALLQATGQNPNTLNIPLISGVTSNVRIASNPQTTSLGSNPTTPLNVRPVYTTTNGPVFKTFAPRTVTTTFQPVTDAGISTTFQPFNRGRQTTTTRSIPTTLTGRRAPVTAFTSTTEMPSSSTFSVEEDLAFLNNLKTVLKTNPNNEDPEAALANRIIALAVERSLNEIQTGTSESVRTGKNIAVSGNNLIPSTNKPTTTPTTTTTTTPRPTTTTQRPTTTTQRLTTTQRPTTTINPSLEDDIRQFQEDTKLLQALLKATGQDPSKLNLPTLPNLNVSPKLPNSVSDDLKLLSNLLASPSPLNEPFDSLTPKPTVNVKGADKPAPTTALPYGAKIAVKDNLKNEQDDKKLLQTLIKLQGAQETTTQKSKLAITGQSSDEALKKLIQQTQSTGMVSEATRAPMSLSTEYGKSNDALLAALLKEQGFGPTTASSLDEQLRLAALLNQVVVTPKTRRTTTPPPPPPAPRRPILDGLAWLWQQWRETAPGPGGATRPNRGPTSAPSPSARPSPSAASSTTGNRVNWFGSGPFVGNADDRPANRIPLEPPRAVTAEQSPGRGQLVSAAINVTRAFSQFLGAAIQGAAQTVQSVIRAGQRAATDVYVNGSGGSG